MGIQDDQSEHRAGFGWDRRLRRFDELVAALDAARPGDGPVPSPRRSREGMFEELLHLVAARRAGEHG
jgi:hypothetical protein